MDSHSLTAALKEEAARLGFELVGVTTPDPPPHLDVFQRWLADHRHGSMHYLATDRALARRSDPRRILPECRSILVVGIRHAPPSPPDPGGRVAAYARGADYHTVVVDRLEQLMRFLEPRASSPLTYRLYSDTGPILERELAMRAGLGWIGKNTCLIHPRHGSYFLLGEAFLSVALNPDRAFVTDHCGACTRCLEACPTDCILPDRTLDATRCISYLTIEQRGAIPVELRPAVGDWLFGCDICQQVCPWNVRFAGAAGDPEFQPGPDPRRALPFLETPPPALKGTALSRARWAGMARNAAIVLGNAADPRAAGRLIETVQGHPDPTVRAHAAWALAEIGGSEAKAGLEQAGRAEHEPEVRREISSALRRIDRP